MDFSTKRKMQRRRDELERARLKNLMRKYQKSGKLAIAGMIQNITGLGDFDDSHFSQ